MTTAPLSFDYGMSRADLYVAAKTYLMRGLPAVDWDRYPINPFTLENARYGSGGKLFGEYRPEGRYGKVYVNVAKSTYPPRVKGRVWSYPGHKSDRTAAGILAHEVGHLLHHRHNALGNSSSWKLDWVAVVDKTYPITSYEPTYGEALAESFRVFLLNPDLLRRGCRPRFDFLTRVFGIKPIHNAPYLEVLRNAPDFIRASATAYATAPNGNVRRTPSNRNKLKRMHAL